MFNNRKYINELIKENESLNVLIKFWEQSYELAKVKNKKLQADIEVKENNVCNLLDSNKELSQHNNYLQNQNLLLNNENVKLIKESNQKDRRLENQRINLKNYREQIDKLCEEKSMLEKVIRKHEENEC